MKRFLNNSEFEFSNVEFKCLKRIEGGFFFESVRICVADYVRKLLKHGNEMLRVHKGYKKHDCVTL